MNIAKSMLHVGMTVQRFYIIKSGSMYSGALNNKPHHWKPKRYEYQTTPKSNIKYAALTTVTEGRGPLSHTRVKKAEIRGAAW